MDRPPGSGHPAFAGFAVRGDDLMVGGVPLRRLTEQVGMTPYYAYDRARLDKRIRFLRNTLPHSLRLSYAVKANPMPAIVQHLARMVDGFDVASAHEMRTVLDTPISPEHVSFAGPGKTGDELARAIASGVIISLESEQEMNTVAEIAARQGQRPRVALRINPNFNLKASGMLMGGGPRQFGVDVELVPNILKTLASLGLDFIGFHIFLGSQNLDANLLCEAQHKTVGLALELAHYAPAPVRHLNLGGGFGIPYFAKDKPLDLPRIGANLDELVRRLATELPEAQATLELGRYIVGESGVYVARVTDRKVSRGQVYLVTDGGLHHHLAASGNFGQVIRRNYPVVIGTRMSQEPSELATVVGRLCTPLDLLADKVALQPAEIGDLVVVFQSGAYGPSASPTGFLSHPAPPEVLV